MVARQEQREDNSICVAHHRLLLQIDEEWMVMHEHNSISFDVESGKASLDFKP
jgi:hypothetical protein